MISWVYRGVGNEVARRKVRAKWVLLKDGNRYGHESEGTKPEPEPFQNHL